MNSKFLKSALCLTVLGVLNSHVFSMEEKDKILPEENINVILQNSNINSQVLQNSNINIEHNRDNKKDNVKRFKNIDMDKINDVEARKLVDNIGIEISHDKEEIQSYSTLLDLEKYTEKMQNKFNKIKEKYNLEHHSEVIDNLNKYSKPQVSELNYDDMLMEYSGYNLAANTLLSLINQCKVGKKEIEDKKSGIGSLYLDFIDLKYRMLFIQSKIEDLDLRNELLEKQMKDYNQLLVDFSENKEDIINNYNVKMQIEYDSRLQKIDSLYRKKRDECTTSRNKALESLDNKAGAGNDTREIIDNAKKSKRIIGIYESDIKKLEMEYKKQLEELKVKYNGGNFEEKALGMYITELKVIENNNEGIKQDCLKEIGNNENELNKLKSSFDITKADFDEFSSYIEPSKYINGLFKFFSLREEIKFYIKNEESQFLSTLRLLRQFVKDYQLMNKNFNPSDVSMIFGNEGKNSGNEKFGELNIINSGNRVFSDKRINNNNFSSNKGSALYGNINYGDKMGSQSGLKYAPNMGNFYGDNKGLYEIKEDGKESSQKVQMDNYNQDEEKKQENNKEIDQQYEGEEEMIEMNYNGAEMNQQYDGEEDQGEEYQGEEYQGEEDQGEEGFSGDTNQNINNQKK